VSRALEELVDLQRQKAQRKKGEGVKARCSTPDPEARKMKRGDSGFRPADHVQLATDGQSRVIVSDDVTNNGSDRGPMGLVHQNMCERSGNTPTKYLVDGGFATTADIPRVEPAGSEVLAPMTHIDGSIKGCGDPHTPRNGPPRSPLKTCPRNPQTPPAQAKHSQPRRVSQGDRWGGDTAWASESYA